MRIYTWNEIIFSVVLPALGQTLQMVIPAVIMASILGYTIAIGMFITRHNGLHPQSKVYSVLNIFVSMLRAFPFIILIVSIQPLTRIIMGTIIGTKAALVPLTIAGTPFMARMFENSLKEVDMSLIEAAKSLGATDLQIIKDVVFVEAVPSLISKYDPLCYSGIRVVNDCRYGWRRRFRLNGYYIRVSKLQYDNYVYDLLYPMCSGFLYSIYRRRDIQKIKIMRGEILMKTTKKLVVILLSLIMVFALSACDGDTDESSATVNDANTMEKTTIKLSTTEYNYDEVNAEYAIKAMEAKGYTVEVVAFQDAGTQNQAIMNGEIDASLQQHKPFLDSYNESKGTDLTMITPYIHKCDYGLYSMKYDSLDSIPDGATIVIGADASNMARALIFLKSLGWVDFDDSLEIPATLDITANPKNIEFEELATQQVANSLPDVDGVCISRMNIIGLGYDVNDTELAIADEGETYGVGFVVKGENKDAQWVKDLVECYTTDEMRDFINTRYEGAFTPTF